MASQDCYNLERSVLGGPAVYPGHPVVTALMVMHAFPNLDAALAKSKHGWPEALSSGLVPGSGGYVYQGLDLLTSIREGAETAEAAVERHKANWLKYMPGDIERATEPGHAQAEAITQAFFQKLESWMPERQPAIAP